MLKFTLMLFLPCLILADTHCPGEDLSCPEGKTCCTVDDKPSCCDEYLEATPPPRSALLSAPNNMTDVDVQNGSGFLNANCNYYCPGGTCCLNGGMPGCCPIQMATCCSNGRCCKLLDTCCGISCCPRMNKCCGANVCCPTLGTCCGSGCCSGTMSKCCGSWCCKSNQRCGLSYLTCFNAGALLSPATLTSLLAVWIAVYLVGKI